MSKAHNVTNLVVIALGIFVAYYSYHFLKLGILISPDAGFMPFLCGIALIILGVVWRLHAPEHELGGHKTGDRQDSLESAP